MGVSALEKLSALHTVIVAAVKPLYPKLCRLQFGFKVRVLTNCPDTHEEHAMPSE